LIPFLGDVQATYEALLGQGMIARQQERQQMQAVHIVLEDTAKISTCCVRRRLLVSDFPVPEHFRLPHLLDSR
jgi:hypothetical protein